MANKYSQHSKKFNLRRRIHGGKCIRKKQFTDAESAERFAESGGWNQKPYKCNFCPCWHLKSK